MVTPLPKATVGKFNRKFTYSISKISEIFDGWFFRRLLYITGRVYSWLWPVLVQDRCWYSCLPPTSCDTVYSTSICICRFDGVPAVLRFTVFHVLRHVNWNGGSMHMNWDIYLLINASAPLATQVSECFKLFWGNSCVPSAIHSWPCLSFVLSASSCCSLIDVWARCALNRVLCIRQSRLMQVYIHLLGHLKLIGGSFKRFLS